MDDEEADAESSGHRSYVQMAATMKHSQLRAYTESLNLKSINFKYGFYSKGMVYRLLINNYFE